MFSILRHVSFYLVDADRPLEYRVNRTIHRQLNVKVLKVME